MELSIHVLVSFDTSLVMARVLENKARAKQEVARYAPRAIVYENGNTNHMIANADVVLTRYSSLVLLAAAMGKEIHSALDPHCLRRVRPLQTAGTSAHAIASLCKELVC